MFETEAQEGGRIPAVAVELLCSTSTREPVRLPSEERDAYVRVNEQELHRYALVPGFAAAVPEAFHAARRGTSGDGPGRSGSS